ncbi:MAG: hypothetical protein AABW56_05065 [Nanoarchaeota archaeon]
MKIIFLLLLLLILPLVNAQELQVIKEASNSITQNEILEVKIIVNNLYSEQRMIEVREVIPQGATLIDPSMPDNYEYNNGILTEVLSWQINLKPKEVIYMTYSIKTDGLGEYGLRPTIVTDKKDNKVYLSNAIQFSVYCFSNNICEINENNLNCPFDCKIQSNDNLCDYKLDDVCDEDCKEDPDCKFYSNPFFTVLVIILLIIIILYLFLTKKK